jgi:hypothetical protein
MSRAIGRRPLFFSLVALVAAILVPFTPPEFRWTCWFCIGLALFWALALAIEDLTAPGGPPDSVRGRPGGREGGTPFAPPPLPRTGEGSQGLP